MTIHAARATFRLHRSNQMPFTPDEPLSPPPPHWGDPFNLGARLTFLEQKLYATQTDARETQAELTALRNEIRALIAAGRTKQGWVSCNVLEQTLEAPR